MINEIKKLLARGEVVELECVDKDSLKKCHKEANEELLSSGLVVKSVEDKAIVIEDCYINIVPREYKYFRIKRPAPTFDDLIDVAVKAVRDKVIYSFNFTKAVSGHDLLEVFETSDHKVNDLSHLFNDTEERVIDGINFINSLYTETFVIESVEDINKVISRKEIGFNKKHITVATLMNGNEILITKLDSDNTNGVVVYMRDGLYKNYLGIDVLKGATVTQKRQSICLEK